MATPIQIEVLLELTMGTLAEISRAEDRGETTEELSKDDTLFLWKLRDKLYSIPEEEFDYDKTANEINAIFYKYHPKEDVI